MVQSIRVLGLLIFIIGQGQGKLTFQILNGRFCLNFYLKSNIKPVFMRASQTNVQEPLTVVGRRKSATGPTQKFLDILRTIPNVPRIAFMRRRVNQVSITALKLVNCQSRV